MADTTAARPAPRPRPSERHSGNDCEDLGTDYDMLESQLPPLEDGVLAMPQPAHLGQMAVDNLVRLLDLEPIEENIFRGARAKSKWQRVFGGQVAGQALVAAGRTVDADRRVHSLHSYFIRPGDPSVPIIYNVDRVRDGRSFTTRRVVAVQ